MKTIIRTVIAVFSSMTNKEKELGLHFLQINILDRSANLTRQKRLFCEIMPILFLILFTVFGNTSYGQTSVTFTTPGTNTFTVPAGVTSLTVECWGAGGAGGGAKGLLHSSVGGGGGGGAYSKNVSIPVTSGMTISYTVGAGGIGSTGNGTDGGTTTFSTVTANGGKGGTAGLGDIGNNNPGAGGVGGTGGTYAGGNGAAGVLNISGGGGGGGAGTASNGNNGSGVTGGAAVTGAGAGGNGGVGFEWLSIIDVGQHGFAGASPGGGGGGGDNGDFQIFGYSYRGGNGANGQIKITYNCVGFSLTSVTASPVNLCAGNSSSINLISTATGLPVGVYDVEYQIQGVTQPTASMNVTTAGTGSFVATGFTATSTIKITKLTSKDCSSTMNNTATVDINSSFPTPTLVDGSAAGCDRFTANWAAVTGATYYELDVSTNSTFSNFVSGYSAKNVGNVLSSLVTGLSSGVTYFYRVRAYNGTCLSDNPATPISIATLSSPAAPVLGSFVNACDELRINWAAATDAASYTIEWSTSAANFSPILGSAPGITALTYNITGLTPGGQYRYRVRSVNSCSTSINATSAAITMTGTAPGEPGAIASTSPFCDQVNLTWSAPGSGTAAASYNIEWSTDSGFTPVLGSGTSTTTSYNITGLTAGTGYYYRVSSVNGCGTSGWVNGTGSPNITTSSATPADPTGVSSSDISCNQFTMSWSAAAGASSYNVQRASNISFTTNLSTVNVTETTYTFTGLTAGTPYYFRVQSKSSCGGLSAYATGSPNFITTSSPPATPTITPSGSLTFCQSDGVTLTSSPGATYLWSTGETTSSIFVNAAGSYTVKVSDASGCQSASSAASITATNALPTATAGGSKTICSDGSATVIGATSTNGTILWTHNGTGSLSNATTLTPTYTANANDSGKTVTLTMTVTSNNSCAPKIETATYSVIVSSPPTVTLTSNATNNIFCPGTSVTFTATGTTGTTYEFFVDDVSKSTASTYTTNTLTNGQRVYVIASKGGCSTKSNEIINTVYPAPNITLTSSDSDNKFCAGTSVTFTATGGTKYDFYVKTGTGNPVNVSSGSSSTYTTTGLTNGQIVTVTVSNGLCSATSTGITNTVDALPTATLTSSAASNTFCAGASVTFTATPAGAAKYEFLVNGVKKSTNDTSSTYTTTSLVNNDKVSVIITNSAGCSKTSAEIINTVNAFPAATITSSDSDNTFCAGTSVTFTAPAGGTTYDFWVDNVKYSGTLATYTTSTLTNGQKVHVDVTNSSGCKATSPDIINTVNALPTPTISSNDADNSFCAGTSITFTATGGTKYEFLVNGVKKSTDDSSPTYTTTLLANNDKISVIVTNANGCSKTSDEINNIVNAYPTATLTSNDTDNKFCSGTSVMFTATTVTGATYEFFVDGISKSTTNPYTNATLTNNQKVYTLVTTAGCSTKTNEITNTVYPVPTATLTSSDTDNLFCIGNSVTFTASGGNTYSFFVKTGAAAPVNVYTGPLSTYTASFATAGQRIVTVNVSNGLCSATSAGITSTVSDSTPSAPITSITQPTCTTATGLISINIQSASDTYSFDGGGTYQAGNIKTGLNPGNYTVFIQNIIGCKSSANITIQSPPSPAAAPTIGTVTQASCTSPDNSVVLNGLPSGSWTIHWINDAGGVTATGSSRTLNNLAPGTYNFTITNAAGCISSPSISVTISDSGLKKWVGGTSDWFTKENWQPQEVPTAADCVIIPNNPILLSINGGIAYANTLTVENGGKMEVNSGTILVITDFVKVADGGTMTVENNAAVIQINDVDNNSGTVNVIRKTSPVLLNDYTYWSSPTSGTQTLSNFSPNSNPKYFLSYSNGWLYHNGNTTVFDKGTGYAILSPRGISATTPAVLSFQFNGALNNGNIPTAVVKSNSLAFSSKLIGNPYPSALDADKFILANLEGTGTLNQTISGTLYFWTHNKTSNDSNPNNDYASYNLTGSTGTGIPATGSTAGWGNPSKPTQWIASGQGFLVETKKTGNVTFTNDMRIMGAAYANANFYKNSTGNTEVKLEKNRIWLNLTDDNLNFSQTLIGYIESATNDYDPGFDGTYSSPSKIGIYSLIGNESYVIQGRALPFTENDIVRLGYKIDVPDKLTISIDSVDGLFAGNQNIFLEDKLLGVTHNLKSSPYTFNSEAGVFNDRFNLKYIEPLGVNDINNPRSSVIVSSKNQQIKIQSTFEDIHKVYIFDMLGRTIYKNSEIKGKELLISEIKSQQVLYVKIVLDNGQVVNKKIINQ